MKNKKRKTSGKKSTTRNLSGDKIIKKKTSKKNKSKRDFFINNFKESLLFIKESRNYIYSIVALFLFSVLIGFFVPVPETLQEEIVSFFEEIVRETEGMSLIELIMFIMLNNLQASFIGMILGVFLGIFPVISSISNGYIVGVAANLSANNAGFASLLRLLPHGIFELPALFISLGLGVRLGFSFIKKSSFKEDLINSLKVFLYIVVPLLIVAGIIEGFLIFVFS